MGGRRSTDIVKSFLFSSLPLKAEDQPERFVGWSSAVEEWLGGDQDGVQKGSKDAPLSTSEYLHELTTARGKLLSLLQVTSSSSTEVAAAQSRYLGLLVEAGAVEQKQKQQQMQGGDAATYPVLRSTWIDTLLPLAAFKAGGGSSSSSTHAGSKWFGSSSRKKQAAAAAAALAQEAPDPPSGYAFEAANILLAVATWKMTKAGSIVGAAGGADSTAAMDAYQLYCQAAGLLDELRRKLLPLVPSSTCGDLQRELLCALHYFALGEAQSMMLQRGVALNYQGSTLAPMATDTAMLFGQAYEAIEATAKALNLPWNFLPPADKASSTSANNNSSSSSNGGSSSSGGPAKNTRMAGFERLLSGELPQHWPVEATPLLQLAAYVQFQLGHCYCLASICAAEMALSSNQAGQAVALAQLGTNLCSQLQDMGFEQSSLIDPAGSLGARDSSRRLSLQATLEQKAANVLRKCLRENRTIYFQFVPEQPSALPWPQRSAQPELFRLPNPQGKLTAAAAQGLVTATAVGASLSDFEEPDPALVPVAPAADSAAALRAVSSPRALAAVKQQLALAPSSLSRLAQETAFMTEVVQLSVSSVGSDGSQESYSSTSTGRAAAEEALQQQVAVAEAVEEPEEEAVAPAAAEGTAAMCCFETEALQVEEPQQQGSTATDAAAEQDKQLQEMVAAAEPVAEPAAAEDLTPTLLPAATGLTADASADESTASSSIMARSAHSSSSWSGSDSAASAASADSTASSQGAGGGGFLWGLFGCCTRPECHSEDAESFYDDSEELESCDEAWESSSEASLYSTASKCSNTSKYSSASKYSTYSKYSSYSTQKQQPWVKQGRGK